MSRRSWKQWFFQQFGLAKESTKRRSAPRVMAIETLGERITPAVNAFFTAGILTVVGDNNDNTIEVSRDAAGKLSLNGGAIAITGGTATVTNTTLIQVFGVAGNDTISLNEVNGALPRANLYGGAGDDVLTGGSGNDQLFGEAGNDKLLSKGGVDFLFGGLGNDTLTGGAGDDQVFGEGGNDRMIWNPGDGSDLNEGGADSDTVEVNGGNGAEAFTVTANGSRVRFDRTNPAPFFIDIGTSEFLNLNANGGDDSFSASGNLATLIQMTVDGGAGNDRLLGGNGADRLLGGDGNDFVDGNGGNDSVLLGAGDDTFQWDPGDGSDTVDGQDGSDTMIFNGSAADEKFAASANGERVRLTRDVGGVVMDLNGIERMDLNAVGGADEIAVNDLTGTALTVVNIDLAGTLGDSAGDAAVDNVIVSGTTGDDVMIVAGDASGVSIFGLAAQVNILHAEPTDKLAVNALAGDDVITAVGLAAGAISLTEDGGDGNDIQIGGDGNDTLLGGAGDDVLEGGAGVDVLDGGTGANILIQD